MDDLSIIIPSFNENHDIITETINGLKSMGAEVIVVDDGSDNPYPDAIKHGVNQGYGSALMTGIKNATRNIVMTIDSDGQHSKEEAIKLYTAFKLIGNTDMLIGARRLKHETPIRFLGRKLINWTASIICLYWLPDLNSGARVMRRDVAIGYFPILCKTFSFTTSITISMLCDGYRVEWFPINVKDRVHGSSRVRLIKDGLVTVWYILKIGFALRTRRIRQWIRNLSLKST